MRKKTLEIVNKFDKKHKTTHNKVCNFVYKNYSRDKLV